jgi:phenylalanyl-tRNA synthetase beta chain
MALKIPLRWLRDFVDYTATPDQLTETLTIAGLEVDGVEVIGGFWSSETLVVAQIEKVDPHPEADSLCLATVNHGEDQSLVVVTGAPNIFAMIGNVPAPTPKIPLALVGAQVIDVYSDEYKLKKLKPLKIRGIPSEGMACSEKELGLSEEHEEVLMLPEDAPVGAPLRDYLGERILHFDIKGGFSHLLCVHGIARETAAIYGLPLKNEFIHDLPEAKNILENAGYVNLRINDPDLCTRYTTFRIKGVKIGPSPFWMQQRLRQCGMRPINNIVDITNYVMLELGQPLHAFDYGALVKRSCSTPTICVRRAQPREVLVTLDEIERKLDPEMLLITDEQGPIAIAGMMGGSNTEVSEATTDILLEAAHFEFLNNRRTSQLLKLKTEAAERFGKRLDPELPLLAGWRAARLIAELAGGTLEPIVGDLYPSRPEPVSIELRSDYIERILGIQMSEAEVLRILRALEFEVVVEQEIYRIQVPAHRQDVGIPADLVEELVRVYGYNRLPPTSLADELPPQRENYKLNGVEKARDLLVGAGLDEVITYSLNSPLDEAKLRLQSDASESMQIGLLNPLSQERSHLRQTLLVGLLQTARENLRLLSQIQIFEVGGVFMPQDGETLPAEPRRLAVLLTGLRQAEAWQSDQSKTDYDFYDLKGRLEILLAGLHLQSEIRWERSDILPYHPGRCTSLFVGEQMLGHIGELHPKIRSEFSLPEQPVCVAELDLDLLINHWQQAHQMHEVSGFTPIYEDLAVIVKQNLPVAQILREMQQVGRPLLKQALLFDVYTGEQIAADKKSLAFALTFQANDRTLQDKDVQKIRQKIVRQLERTCGAQLRS